MCIGRQAAATGNGGGRSSRLHHLLRGTEASSEGDPPLIATADSGGSLRLWSRWPLPQQLADFSLPHPCTALAFLWRSLLLGCFKDGSLRIFDTNAFRLVGRLQLATTQDPPVAIACLGGEGAIGAVCLGFGVRIANKQTHQQGPRGSTSREMGAISCISTYARTLLPNNIMEHSWLACNLGGCRIRLPAYNAISTYTPEQLINYLSNKTK